MYYYSVLARTCLETVKAVRKLPLVESQMCLARSLPIHQWSICVNLQGPHAPKQCAGQFSAWAARIHILRDGRAVIKLRPSKLLMHTMQSLKICSRTLYTNLQGPRVPTKSAVLFAAVGTRTCMLRDGGGCYKITANKTGLCTRYFLFQYTPRVYIPIYRALGRQKKAQFSLRWSLLARICFGTVNAVIK